MQHYRANIVIENFQSSHDIQQLSRNPITIAEMRASYDRLMIQIYEFYKQGQKPIGDDLIFHRVKPDFDQLGICHSKTVFDQISNNKIVKAVYTTLYFTLDLEEYYNQYESDNL